jgi:hypothetical protein
MIYSITDGKLVSAEVPENHRLNNLPIGTIIKFSGDMANRSTTYIVIGKRESNYGNSYQVIDSESYRETFLDTFLFKGGNRWIVTDEIASPDTILNAVSMAKIKKAHEEEAKELERQRRDNLEEQYKKDNPLLEVGQGMVVAARNIRKELKKAFPGVKFSVRSHGYSGGNDIRIEWADGPTLKAVKEITNKYQEGHFDEMTDSYNYDRQNVWTEVFGGTKYIFTNRKYSDSHIQKALDNFGTMDGKTYTVDDYKMGRIHYSDKSHGYWVHEEMEKF